MVLLASLCRNVELPLVLSRYRGIENQRILSYSTLRKTVTETQDDSSLGKPESRSNLKLVDLKSTETKRHKFTFPKIESSSSLPCDAPSVLVPIGSKVGIENCVDTSSKDSYVSVTSVIDKDSGIQTESVSERIWQKVGQNDSAFQKYISDVYLPLSKIRLTTLVVCTALEGYGMAPASFPFDPIAFSALIVGTTMTSACANSVNQILETPYDSQMNRTKNRPLIRGKLTPLHAATFAAVSGTTGVAILLVGTNPLTAVLGLSNILLYTCIYTPMKRLSVANTWVGSVVGAIPPMMGWAACTGALEPGAWILGAFLYCWQFPHFKALSWNLKADYSRAGYRMSSVIDPAMCRRVCIRHSVAMIPLSILAAAMDVTSWWFVVDSMPFNLYLIYLSWRFYQEGSSKSSKKLFRFSLLHIPVILLLMIVSKHRTVSDKKKELVVE